MADLSDADKTACTDLFDKYDADKSNKLTLNEIVPMVKDLGWEPEMATEEKIKNWFSGTDVDKGITRDQFMAAYGQNNLKDRRLAFLQRTFKKVDYDNSGSISEEELKDGIEKSFFISWDDCEAIVKDIGKDGQIKICDFIKYFRDSSHF